MRCPKCRTENVTQGKMRGPDHQEYHCNECLSGVLDKKPTVFWHERDSSTVSWPFNGYAVRTMEQNEDPAYRDYRIE